MSNGIGRVWAVNAEGGDEGRPNGVGPVWIENADQLGSKLPEPEAGDAGKVLGVLNSDGDLGWVVDQEGMAQVQSDWDQDDPSQVSYIANKPSLATVATTGAYSDLSGTPTIPTVDQTYDAASPNAQSGVAVASALSGKQDTISDLSTIRSGASAGATAVQPAALNDYATTSALTSGLAAKQDTISDLATIRSGASAGATAVQPGSLATVATSGLYSDLSNKPDLSVYATSTDLSNGLATKQDTISDLSTIRSGASAGATAVQPGDLATVATSGSYNDLSNKPNIPATKPLVAGTNVTITENANDVTISAAGGASYSAGTGIDITNNVISADTTVLATKTDLSAYTPTASLATVATTGAYSDLSGAPTINNVPAVTSSDDDKVLKASYSDGVGSYAWESEPTMVGLTAGSNVTITEANNAVTIAATDTTYSAGDGIAIASNTVSADVDGTTIGIDSTTKKIKLLSTIPTVPTAGNMLSVTNDTLNVTTTAGITDIQQVAALPANPVSTVLYLIQET